MSIITTSDSQVCQVQGTRPTDGSQCHTRGAEKQLLLRRRLRSGGNGKCRDWQLGKRLIIRYFIPVGRLHVLDHQVGSVVRVQQPPSAWQVGRVEDNQVSCHYGSRVVLPHHMMVIVGAAPARGPPEQCLVWPILLSTGVVFVVVRCTIVLYNAVTYWYFL